MHFSNWVAVHFIFNRLYGFYSSLNASSSSSQLRVLDVGACDVNGNSRDIIAVSEFRHLNYTYVGMDNMPCLNVDVVADPASPNWEVGLPFDAFDVIISTNAFEHDEFFWETFLHITNLLAPGGYLVLLAPMRSFVHRHPVDSWRFQIDSPISLLKWALRNNQNVSLLYYDIMYTELIDDITTVYWKNVDGVQPVDFKGLSNEILVNLHLQDLRRKPNVTSDVHTLKGTNVLTIAPELIDEFALAAELIDQINCHYLATPVKRAMHRHYPFDEDFEEVYSVAVTTGTGGDSACDRLILIRYSAEDVKSPEAIANATAAAAIYFDVREAFPNFDDRINSFVIAKAYPNGQYIV